jgi:two-component system heavy metal sensor histidine kinase CusS
LSRIIDSLLLLARAELPARELDREPIDLSSELERIHEYYDVLMADAEIEWVVRCPAEVTIQANRPLLQRAIGNLIENALQHTPPGGAIAVCVMSNELSLRIEVADNGAGIPSEDLPHVFDRFYRVEKDRSSSTGGSGLGLAIVRSVMELHGGEVTIESIRNIGTTVVMFLPHNRLSTDKADDKTVICLSSQ